jgi:Cu-Zn family superoxide dismutase
VRNGKRNRTLRTAGAAALAAAFATGSAAVTGTADAAGGLGPDYWLGARGRFEPAAAEQQVLRAVTYDETLVPSGATIEVGQRITGDRMSVEVTLRGVLPGHTYGAHVHTEPCGADPAAAGGHYQNEPGVVNEHNEVWLDFTADENGAGQAVSRHDWIFREGEAGSVVVHEHATSTGRDGTTPGDAGDRVACLTVPFAGLNE